MDSRSRVVCGLSSTNGLVPDLQERTPTQTNSKDSCDAFSYIKNKG